MSSKNQSWEVECMDCGAVFTHHGEPQTCPECECTQVTGADGSDLPNRVFTIYWEYADDSDEQ